MRLSHLTQSITIQAAPTFALSGPTSQTSQAGQTVNVQWTAGNVKAGSKISLCYDADATWNNGNEHWIEVDQVSAANGPGSYVWNTTGVAAGTYYIAGYLYDGTYTLSHLTQSITIQAAPTFALSGPTSQTYQAGQTVNVQWAAGNVKAGSKISLCYDADATWNNGNEHWIEVDQVSAGNGPGSYVWNTTGVAAGTYYLAGYMYDGSFTLSHLTQSITIQAAPTFALNNPTSGTYQVGQTVNIQWSASNVGTGGKISLCYDADTTWNNGNEHWIEVDQVSAANGPGSYTWNLSGVPVGTYYVAGYLYTGGKFYLSHLANAISIVIRAPVMHPTLADAPEAAAALPGSAVLESRSKPTPIADEAIRRLSAETGGTVLPHSAIEIADLFGANAAAARDDSPAAHRADLLTAVMREMAQGVKSGFPLPRALRESE